jgi:hypothetical protein
MTTIIECRPPVAEKPAEGHQDQAKTRQPDQGFPLMPGSGQTGTLQARGLPGCPRRKARRNRHRAATLMIKIPPSCAAKLPTDGEDAALQQPRVPTSCSGGETWIPRRSESSSTRDVPWSAARVNVETGKKSKHISFVTARNTPNWARTA